MQMSLSATYHCTAAVAATALTMTLGTKGGSVRISAHDIAVPLAPPIPIAPSSALSSKRRQITDFPPSIIASLAAVRSSEARSSQLIPTASARSPPDTLAPATPCGRSERSISHGSEPTRANTSRTKSASAPLLSIVTRTAMMGLASSAHR